MKRGEIWWVEDPAAGRRPHLILTRSAAIGVLTQILAVPATTTIRDIPTEVPLGKADGMPRDCVLSLDNIHLVRRAHFVERITELGSDRLGSVCEALGIATDC
ncbi:MAG: type II toxin-antitoxin system PemK/MazF family toxin [Actinomycetota bacterium]